MRIVVVAALCCAAALQDRPRGRVQVSDPSLNAGELERLVEKGIDVVIDSEKFYAYELERLGGRKGRARLVVTGRKYYVSDLQRFLKAGVDVEIRSAHFSIGDLERLANP